MYKDIYEEWKNSENILEKDRETLCKLNDETDIEYRFGKDLEFGTAGMRGIIGLGTNMMNIYTVKRATQGLCEYIKSLGDEAKNRGVVISYDTRRMSYEFAYESALVLVSNGIKAYLFERVHPVPLLSFAVRELNTIAGIMITASHNPKEYNGYKVYGEDGAQMSPEATKEVVKHIEKLSCTSSEILSNSDYAKKILVAGKKIDKKYYKAILRLTLAKKETKKFGKKLKIVYTPVHGSGYIPVTTILKKIGIKPILVPEQVHPDTEFSTVAIPNPEFKETLSLGIKMADWKKADVVFGTDPDCDRLGVAIRNDKGEFVALSGNQTGILLLDYVLSRAKENGTLENGFVVKSFVTTGMAKLIADDYGVKLFETPVGFKFIGEKIKEYDDTNKMHFLFGFEESCGYLRGTHCRDKDAVVASMLFAEMTCYYQYHKISIYDKLQEIYSKYGFVFDTNISTAYKGLNAMKDMNATVDKLKTVKIDSLGGLKVLATRDYSASLRIDDAGNKIEIDVPKNNAVYYELSGGSFVCVRPSGTEPKLKVYYSIKGENENVSNKLFEQVKKDFEGYIK